MSDAVAVRERHVWDQLEPVWHVVFAVFALVGFGLVASGAGPPGSRGPALVLVTAVAVSYAVLGGRALGRDPGSRLGWAYLLLAVPLVLTLFSINRVGGGVLLFLVFPHVWRLLPTVSAVVVTTLLAAGVATQAVRGAPDTVPSVLGWAGAVFVAALLLGLWISRIAAQSVRRAELLAELDATRAELAAAHRDIGALAERERLAREIHDTLAQGFTSILLLSQALDDDLDDATRRAHVRRVQSTARENLAESRTLVAALAPTALGDATLPAALRRLVDRIGHESGVRATMTVEGDERALPAAVDVVLLRVSQEALANVRRHAGAGCVELTLGYRDDGVSLDVRDDGCGFAVAADARGFGLAGMRDRVREIGGTLAVHAAPGAGTCVEVRV